MNFANGSGSEWGRGVDVVIGFIGEKPQLGLSTFPTLLGSRSIVSAGGGGCQVGDA